MIFISASSDRLLAIMLEAVYSMRGTPNDYKILCSHRLVKDHEAQGPTFLLIFSNLADASNEPTGRTATVTHFLP